jgi:septal ring factor EnvC (AmiA/AmiB activator)
MDKYLRILIEHHAELTKTYKHELALRRGDETKLVENRIEIEQSICGEEKKRDKGKKTWNQEQARLKSTVNQKATCERAITEIEKRSNLIQSLIGKLERQKQVLSSKKSKHVMPKGKLQLPVQGKVISFFKERGANGIEIEAPIGSRVRAVLPGKVLYSDWFKGFGNIIIIDHGDSIVTISANCSKLKKKRGDAVSEGETIARIESPESDGDPHLYFEIRHQGKPKDPLNWILSGRNKHP